MTKVFKFEATTEEYLKRADAFLERRDFMNAADNYFRVYDMAGDNVRAMIGMGEVYRFTLDCDQSLIWYMRALATDDTVPEIYVGLARLFHDMGPDFFDSTVYYYKYALSKGAATYALIAACRRWERDGFEPIYEADSPHGINEALKFRRSDRYFKNGAICTAYQMMDRGKVPSNQFAESRRMLLRMDYDRFDYEKVLDTALSILEYAPNDFQARMYAAEAYHYLGKKKRCDEMYKGAVPNDFDAFPSDFGEFDDYIVAACVASKVGAHDDSVRYMQKIVEYLPYDRNALLRLAESYANVGDLSKARETIIDVLRLYPDDEAIKFYRDEIMNTRTRTKYILSDTIPDAAADKKESELFALTDECETAGMETVYEAALADDKLYGDFKWIFQEGDYERQIEMGAKLGCCRLFHPLLSKVLLQPLVEENIKYAIVRGMVRSSEKLTLKIACDSLLNTVYYVRPKGFNNTTLGAYECAFARLSQYCGGYEEELIDLFSRAAPLIEKMTESNGKLDVVALAAAICCKANIAHGGEDEELFARIFHCDKRKVRRYCSGRVIDLKSITSTKVNDPRRGYYGIRY